MACIGPVSAATWVTAVDVPPASWRNNQSRHFQVDMTSIVVRNGWTYANHRVCRDWSSDDCSSEISLSVNCRQEKVSHKHPIILKKHNGDEWWSEVNIERGSRWYSHWSKERADLLRLQMDESDYIAARIYNFFCS